MKNTPPIVMDYLQKLSNPPQYLKAQTGRLGSAFLDYQARQMNAMNQTSILLLNSLLAIQGRLTLISALDPDAGFKIDNAMRRNQYIHALAGLN